MINMEENTDTTGKKFWTEANTRLLILEFKKYYSFWRNRRINKKKEMWEKVAKGLLDQGYEFTASQVENRFKTLQRRHRKSVNTVPVRRQEKLKRLKRLENEVTDMIQNATMFEDSTIQNNGKVEWINENISEANIEDTLITDTISLINEPGTSNFTNNVKFALPRKRPSPSHSNKNTSAILIEIKELIKKVEIRRQARHEQYMKIVSEKNEIMKRKNDLLEQMLERMSATE